MKIFPIEQRMSGFFLVSPCRNGVLRCALSSHSLLQSGRVQFPLCLRGGAACGGGVGASCLGHTPSAFGHSLLRRPPSPPAFGHLLSGRGGVWLAPLLYLSGGVQFPLCPGAGGGDGHCKRLRSFFVSGEGVCGNPIGSKCVYSQVISLKTRVKLNKNKQ